MKNLADCKSSMASSGMSTSTTNASGQDESNVFGVWDLRDELGADGPWKQKCDMFGDIFYETVLQDVITVLRSLKWLSSPRWLLVEAVAENDRRMECDPEAQGSSSNRQDAPQRGEELADEMCAGTVIRSPHLTRILYNFIFGAVYFLYKFRGN